ncbi:ATP-binding protein [Niveibacterium terrae]|uniref:ATP-binding protein n=1 Tax=Niveibacterium terrae TaxID=3373598 RepID=UPI003A8FAA96
MNPETSLPVADTDSAAASGAWAWGESNQRRMGSEFARLKALLRGAAEPPAPSTEPAAIDEIVELFSLSPFERDLLLLAAGVEMDGEFAPLLSAASAPPQPCATFGLALAMLPLAHWSALSPQAPLRRWRLLELGDGASLISAPLRIDERILHLLAGLNEIDGRLCALLRELPLPALIAEGHERIVASLCAELAEADQRASWPVVVLEGGDLQGKRDIAVRFAAELGLRVFALAATDIPAAPTEREALATLWEREAALLPAALLIEAGAETGAAELIARLSGLTLLATAEPVALDRQTLRHRVDKPERCDQLALWRQVLGASGSASLGKALESAAAQFRLSASEIRQGGEQLAKRLASPADAADELWRICRAPATQKLDGLAERIDAKAGWADLILPEARKQTLHQIAAQVRHQLTVCDRWGFADKCARGLGISVLFAGESGTGKTMAAEVLARELRLELFRIDLSAVVSKYIGETEKNLARIFAAAEDSGSLLLFDEADALFGRRSEVRDSHDRYANIEVSYLLQRMEAYRGLAILTSNQKAALDSAFLRRLRFVVSFPFPDLAEREAIWKRIFPSATPREALDCAKLARLSISGGGIRNIALNAAFRAADEGQPVTMVHLLHAAYDEAAKREQTITDAETRGWV